MSNTIRHVNSRELISPFIKQLQPDPSGQDPRTGHSGDVSSSSRPLDSSPFQYGGVRHDYFSFDDEDVQLDAFGTSSCVDIYRRTNMWHSDKELLAANYERPTQRQWQASQLLARISLSSRAPATAAPSGPQDFKGSAASYLHYRLS